MNHAQVGQLSQQQGASRLTNLPPEEGNEEVFRVKGLWPLDFFPDELVIQKKTVSIIRREFMLSYVETVLVQDIGEVIYSDAFIFASLTIVQKLISREFEVRNLSKNKAKQAKDVIDELLVKT